MRRGAKSALIGKWRIVGMALWDNDYLDMVEPAYIQFQSNGLGEFKIGCVVGGLDCTFFADAAEFTWEGSDEMDPVSGRRLSVRSDPIVIIPKSKEAGARSIWFR
jgi:hypothetical protein